MKFGLRDMLLAFSTVAILIVMLSGNHHQQSMGRHLLYVVSVILPSFFFGHWFSRPKEAAGTLRDWRYLRLCCAIGGLVGAVFSTTAVWLLREQLIKTPPFTPQFDFSTNHAYWYTVLRREVLCLLPLSLALGATVGPLLILCWRKVDFDDQDQRNRNTSLVLLGVVVLSWLLAAIDGWQRSYLGSHWLKITALLIPVLILFTYWWIEKLFRSLNRSSGSSKLIRVGRTTKAVESAITQKMPDEDASPRPPEKRD